MAVDGELIIMPQLESGTTLDSASATGTNQDLSTLVRQQPILARVRPVRHVFDGRYSNVENRIASFPDRMWAGKARSPHALSMIGYIVEDIW